MLLVNNNQEYIISIPKAKGGHILTTTTDSTKATDFQTAAIFDVLESIKKTEPHAQWHAITKEELS